jgi:bifunctional non-homologous end joining protein LigD
VPASRDVRLTSADRVLFPDDGIAKGDLFRYYDAVADVLVPHVRDRPFTMKRFPHGIYGEAFFQKQAPKHLPSWIPTRRFTTHPRGGGSREVDFPLVNSREAVLFMVQNNCIDMNAWYSRVDKPDRPDFVLFDLDPPEDDEGFALAVRAALLIRDQLAEVGVDSWAKTSGAGGMHVLAPVQRRSTFRDAHAFAEVLSKRVAEANPGVVTTQWLKEKRRGVFVDYHQNGAGKTIASVYSVRPKPGAPVSTPLRWEEVRDGLDWRAFTMDAVLERVARHGDLFEPVLGGGPPLGPAARRLERLAA